MKVLFLDFDGVLNTREYRYDQLLHCREKGIYRDEENLNHIFYFLDPTKISLVNEITRRSNASIVLSSTWRFQFMTGEIFDLERARLFFSLAGFEAELVGATSRFSSYRGDVIQEWLDRHTEVMNYVILDDDSDMGVGDLLAHFVKVDNQDPKGLQRKHVEKACEILGGLS